MTSTTKPREFWLNLSARDVIEIYYEDETKRLLGPKEWVRTIEHSAYVQLQAKVDSLEQQLLAAKPLFTRRQLMAENQRLRELLLECLKDFEWLNECKCDEAWTSRRKHEPNELCGQFDDLIAKLREIDTQKGDANE